MNPEFEASALLELISRCLRDGSAIEIDGLGRFDLDWENRVIFEPSGRVRVFLAYAQEDSAAARKLYRDLQDAGFEPWLDQEKLLPGQNWPRAIERAIEISDFFIGCFSDQSTIKRGHFQCELRYALDIAARVPFEDIFLVPIRLNDCELPNHIAQQTQYLDLFPDWQRGVAKLIKRGHFQCELRYALDIAARVPFEDIFLVPIRLNDCELPNHIAQQTQYLDLFPDWQRGVAKLIKMMRRQVLERNRRNKSN